MPLRGKYIDSFRRTTVSIHMLTKRFLPLLFLLSLVSTCAEVDISVPGFPQIAHYFHVSEAMVQATITINFLGFFLAAMFYGPLSDAWGRRKIMLLGNALLSIGAIGCAVAPNVAWLLVSRFIQGLGASTSAVLVFTMIADLYQGEKTMKLIGLMNAALAMIMAASPVVGGFINQAIGWRGNYASVAIFSVFVWMLLVVYLPESLKQKRKLDMKKVIGDYAQLFSSSRFLTASFVPSLLFAGYMAYVSVCSFLYQMTYGLSMITFVIHQAIIIASFSMTSLYTQKIITKLGPRNTVRNGMILACGSIVSLILLSVESFNSPYIMTGFMSLFGIGVATVYPVVFSDSLSIIPALQGPASSAVMSMRALLVTMSTAVTGLIYTGSQLTLVISISIAVFLSMLFATQWLAQSTSVAEVEANEY